MQSGVEGHTLGWAARPQVPIWVHLHLSQGDPHMLPRWDRWQFGLRGGSAEEGGAPLAGRLRLFPHCGNPFGPEARPP